MQIRILLFTAQLLFFLGGRICDDLTWYQDEIDVLQPMSIALLVLAIIAKVIRTKLSLKTKQFIKAMMESQFKMIIPYFLTVVVCLFYYKAFGQTYANQDKQYITVLSILSIMLTSLNYGVACHELLLSNVQMWIYIIVLMGQMIYFSTLVVAWLNEQGVQKYLFVVFEATIIILHILIADYLMRIMQIQQQQEIKETFQTRKLLDD